VAIALDPSLDEPVIEPDLPIVDPHQHLWLFSRDAMAGPTSAQSDVGRYISAGVQLCPRYLFDEAIADLTAGHKVRATVFVESGQMYRTDGPEAMRSIGEVEFANGVAAMAASGNFGDARMCAAIVSHVELMLGDGVKEILEAHIDAAGGRLRGVRYVTPYDRKRNVIGRGPHVLRNANVRTGLRHFSKLGLSFDAWVLDSQLLELVDLARTLPEMQIVLNHAGTPQRLLWPPNDDDRFNAWRENLRLLAACENVAVKVGGLMMDVPIQGVGLAQAGVSERLAALWRPYVETCIETFGVERSMFESDYPASSGRGSYTAIWNAFKRIAATASSGEKAALFAGTARRIYRVDVG